MGQFTSDLEKLFARVDAVLDEAARLCGENQLWQEMVRRNINLRWRPSCFLPKTLDFYYPNRLPPPADGMLERDPDMIALGKAITRVQETYAATISPGKRGSLRINHRSSAQASACGARKASFWQRS